MNTRILFIAISVFFLSYCSGGSSGSDDQRSNFLGTWEFVSVYTCTPPGTPEDLTETLVITKEEGGSLGMVLTFDGGLELHATAISETGLGITAEDIGEFTYGGNGSIQEDGSLELLITSSTEGIYCVQDGVATPL